ncbi:MAG: Asp-tRNA(Asn)/Glu-tRNA(Gln) amidotransferase subunit GatB [Bryobacterales bacterium]|nr:Asp-tRNA(Asn)/Glu-tRNA(Gln) amidotransferase subunit GatB [Bryobacterales bacterium]
MDADLAGQAAIAGYEPVIGLEVHVQLKTATKIFSPSSHAFGNAPNTQTDPVVLGLPGALPVLNREAVGLALRAALAIHCRVNSYSQFARKNYFYPDLPKGYQISQYDHPLAEHGWLDIQADGGSKRVGITRLHLEEDAGKTIHDGFPDSQRYSYVDLNRAGAPLCEIVSEPDLRSADEAVAYLNELKLLMQFAGASDCDMEKGQLRCAANVSVRRRGSEQFGTRCEIKNLNSFRFVKQAIQYEIARQAALVENGGTVVQETRLFSTASGSTASMRGKEDSHDYRYFPEPDLPPLIVSDEWLRMIRAAMPELPPAMRKRFAADYGLSDYDAKVLTLSAATAA